MTAFPASSRPAAARAHPPPDGDPLDWIEGRWVLDILLCLNEHERRFSDLRTAIPRVSANVLTDRLRALENTGLVERRRLPRCASQVYALAEPAYGLRPILDALARWRTAQRNDTVLKARAGQSNISE
ncbi:helix-turn-helix transcriptional regulator [Sphingomonas sp. MMSM20]|uniref:winged helix-turn-helix transcriptional regulator n=1 Tax=Sphingomonas lycopersici TaxID=2951807 RepID=UPI0022386972|nr:helix-turn-helix domain-containing protein [Sphingomonas lycopersici]MCW6532224.1 helix-turn-helix transcriptional regulator [Sphingomonas lycopersici]